VRIRTLCIAACALPFAANVSCGSDSPAASTCKDVAACTAVPTLVSAGIACGAFTSCPQTKPACTKPVVPSVAVQEAPLTPAGTPLGTHTVGEVVTFDVPAGTSSITIIEQANGTTADTIAPDTVTLNASQSSPGTTIDNTAVPDQLKSPGGLLYDDNNPNIPNDPSTETVFFGSASPVTGSFTIPNTSRLLADSVNGLQPGKWSFVVNDLGYECSKASNCGPAASKKTTTTYDVRVILKGGAPQTSGKVDAAFYLVGAENPPGTVLTADKAPGDPRVQRMVSSLASLYSKAGICLGTVSFYDVPSWARAQYGLLSLDDPSACGDLDQLFTLSVPGNRLNFFLVAGFQQASGPIQIAGIDGTIPGPSAFGGTVHSGAVVDGSDIASGACASSALTPNSKCGPDELAYIIAHEGGHWMGLYHTTESSGDFFDPIADTSKCPCDPCVPQTSRKDCGNPNVQPVLNGTTCTASASCGGGNNLMFWLLDSASTGALSCEQGGVMRANPVVH